MRRLLALIVISSVSRPEAFAFCGGTASLGYEITSCDDNNDLANAALACVRAYRARVQKAQAEVAAKFQTQIEKQKREQSDSFDRTQAGYEDARRTLQALIAEAAIAHAAVDELDNSMYYPPDYDDPALLGMSTQEYLASEECWAIPKRVMGQSRRMIDKMKNDVAQLEQVALGKQSFSGTRSVNVQALEPPKKVGNTVGQGSGKMPAGRHPTSSSDISGTKKAIDDARKGDSKTSRPAKK